ncbi:hypothetical protein D910_07503 [Dendroctonus ponderosae]|uniref:Trichohyalin-plectin-homology domain-containing protein n=1 Tax=Dendroctonus ponderosae TaxID=77166 RepID=U4U8A6_DENPD|nr:hypothetical protein D910_01715 [Dendroctonus ponderosae]ERL90149.1 hypothetical protein D910_07503 [Dendroctonus ponderosae]
MQQRRGDNGSRRIATDGKQSAKSICLVLTSSFSSRMDSRWFLFPGQTLENTKISDRQHALHITKTGWDGITKHLDRKKILQEAADKEAAIKRYLDEGSKNMTKEWENSLENVRKRKEEERVQLLEKKKEERQLRFLELRKEQEEIREKYMEKVKKQIFMTTGHARDLTSALVTSEILFERQKQQEFMEKLKQHEKDENQKYLEIQQQKAEEEMVAEAEKAKKRFEKQMEHSEKLKQNIEEKAKHEKAMRVERAKKEALDNIEAVKEMEKLEKLQTDEKIRRKKELFEDKKKYLQKDREIKQQKIKEEKELDEVIEIYKEAKHRIDCMKQERVQEMRDAVLKKQEKIAAMVMAEQMDKSEAEEKIIKKAMAEKEAA